MKEAGKTDNTEHKLNTLIQSIPGGVAKIILNNDLDILLASDGFYEMSGYTEEECYRQPFFGKGIHFILEEDIPLVTKAVEQAISDRKPVCTEFRIKRKDGRSCYTTAYLTKVESCGNKIVSNVIFIDMTDITTNFRQLEKNILLDEERYRIVAEQTQDIIFDWDISSDILFYTPVFEKKFGYSIPTEHTMEYLKQSDFILNEDKQNFFDSIKRLKDEVQNFSGEFRLKKSNGSYIWCRFRTTTITDIMGKPYRIVGIIRDIDEYKKENRALKRRAQIDLLTGLLNKMTAQEWIKDCLKHSNERKKHALFIIDIDDFKSVNDHLGHAVGDAVLTEIASRIRSQFRETDIIGRIGGDEFAVFMEYLDSEEKVIQKAEYLCDVFRHSYLGSEGNIHVSGSIGIALYPLHGKVFQQLYERADAALYVAKGKGKDCYAFYSENTMKESLRIHEAVGDNNVESDEYSKVDFSQLIFEILYDISDMNIAVNIILDLISRRYNIQHIFIYTYLREQGIMAKIYEHCLSGENVEFMDHIPCTEEIISLLRQLCDIDGVYLSTEAEAEPEEFQKYFSDKRVHSFLIVPISDDGEFDGIIGYSEARQERSWKKEESDINILLSKIIATFLIKRKQKRRLDIAKEMTSAVLQQANVRTHIVDDNYMLIDTNDQNNSMQKNKSTRSKCYEYFYSQTMPCDDCPIHKLNEKENRYTYVNYTSHNKKWEEITVSEFLWEDASVKYLLTCYDITKHKK